MKAVILAGGQGKRLWPLSRRHKPKQFLPLLSQEALVVQCYRRLLPLFGPADIYVSCVPEFVDHVYALLPQVPHERVIIEPARRDSGPAMAFVARFLQLAGHGNEPTAFIPTDHAIADDEAFLRTIQAGLELVQETGAFADIGIVPTHPLTTLGYTKTGKIVEHRHGIPVHEFLGHVEKPAQDLARQLVESGEYLWHANYYMAKPNALLLAYNAHAPEIFQVMESYDPANPAWSKQFAALKPISIDYAVAEQLPPESMRVLRGSFGWSDIGQFGQLKEWLDAYTKQPAGKGEAKRLKRDSDCLVLAPPDKMVATIGLKNVAVIDTGDVLLVCDLSRSGEVKQLVEQLESDGHESLL